ncbi:MAG: hypothetical protein AVDCRST_MAG69-715 [uncultured Solirubrobacteraceae bacterium]|uniref:Uncharacterized protein n=1 Tax=uncultured Solirubrobacteraceae bacterium TaxID=1162706 RepID=A0A6J4RQN3_9ACTN|nr:MAG: hypothetical protein AVDCRST_MAG69-715 [uncultured Solirubrobacteraceae bacterium]
METTREADSGYPEENPAEYKSADTGPVEESAVRESARPTKEADRAPSNDDGTATGNPLAAGAQPEGDS